MADSLCGPSNALQNFQKHSTIDRTIQQDRLISRPSPAQGFRSSPGPNAALLDPEFKAFQAGQLPLDHSFQPQRFPHAPPSLQQPGPSGWASDFQRLQISNPPSQLHQQPFGPQLQQRQHDSEWHQEFARQQSQAVATGLSQISSQTTPSFRQMGGINMTPQYMGGFSVPQAGQSMAQQQIQQPVEAFDEEAFSRAFDEAARAEAETLQESSQEQDSELHQDMLMDESVDRLVAESADLLVQERIGADTIHDPLSDTPEAREQNDDPDALSKTAAELLGKVERNHTSKFQNSQFLQLMRQFRDKQATVAGDRVVETASGELLGMDSEALKVAS